jgi:hypothetical protein
MQLDRPRACGSAKAFSSAVTATGSLLAYPAVEKIVRNLSLEMLNRIENLPIKRYCVCFLLLVERGRQIDYTTGLN